MFEASVGVAVTVAVTEDPDSNAPMSQATPCGLVTPRWSVSGQEALSPASMAGLPGSSAWVSMGPPLSCKGPRSGSVLEWSVGSVRMQVGSDVNSRHQTSHAAGSPA